MFEIGDYVVCRKDGVCKIEEIASPDFLWADQKKEYYILQPIYSPGSKVYIPVDRAKELMRHALSRQEADALIASIPEIDLIPITNEKTCEEKYKECLRKNDCQEWIRIIKTTYFRKQKRSRDGRKITSVDHKYRKLAMEQLYGEMALALHIPKEEVEPYITKQMEG